MVVMTDLEIAEILLVGDVSYWVKIDSRLQYAVVNLDTQQGCIINLDFDDKGKYLNTSVEIIH